MKVSTIAPNKNLWILTGVVVVLIVILSFFFGPFGPVSLKGEVERFVVPIGISQDEIGDKLKEEGFIKSSWAFDLISITAINPGGYHLSKNMTAFGVSRALHREPYMKWVIIPEGLRKEQIAELLEEELNWLPEMTEEFVTVDTETSPEYHEGVYFPDTYLFSTEETTEEIAERLRTRFDEVFSEYSGEAARQNIIWTTLLKIASIVQREAAGEHDMPLIAGILWNRLLNGQKLDIDATVQYARDTELYYSNDGSPRASGTRVDWWKPISSADKRLDSKYNTYLFGGLPPTPIANPGTHAIEAVLRPANTDCFYYLHDNDGEIHCAPTYDEHQDNIIKYLK